ncbi:hypothetical protein M9434_004276 [Picochlorum sp. BPE23]|nr:hypothetical protein M9434_004276 [Picochlorum sp. BPE23]
MLDSIDKEHVLGCPNRATRDGLEGRPSPFLSNNYHGGGFVSDDDRVDIQSLHFGSSHSAGMRSQGKLSELVAALGYVEGQTDLPKAVLRAGPRDQIYFTPAVTHAAIVTCGSICPGLNDVIRGLVLKLIDYGVPESHILGIRHGFKGFYDKKRKPIILTRKLVDSIQLEGGTMLGTSSEPADVKQIVKRLDLWSIDFLFVIGGPGSHGAALKLQEACEESRVPCSIIAVPKSIDNDILLVDKTFGFESAVEEAQKPLMAAKVEAASGYRGVGLVKLMGRRSGFIAVSASLASGVVDICLIPEVEYRLDSVLMYLESILERKGHAVICIAEGAGEGLSGADCGMRLQTRGSLDGMRVTDVERTVDVGAWLKSEIKANLEDVDVKYIDPSYLIRSVVSTSTDRIYCRMLANGAVHAAFAGYTGITVGLVNTHFVYLPIPAVIQMTRRVDPTGELWNRLRSSIGQPNFEEEPPVGGYGIVNSPSLRQDSLL